jgi:hypothetical protein
MNWFEKHLNWTFGIFGHLLVFFLVLICIAPGEVWGVVLIEHLTNSVAPFRTANYLLFHSIFTMIYFLLTFALYLGVNIWYLRMKRQSYKYLWWLALPSIPLLAYSTGIYNQIQSPIIGWAVVVIAFIMQPVWFGLVAVVMLRLKNNN